jgi:acyl carrier protein
MDIGETVCASIAMSCRQPAESVSLDTELEALSMDSLSFAMVVAQIEAEYHVVLSPDDVLSLVEGPRVADMVRRLEHCIVSMKSTAQDGASTQVCRGDSTGAH